MLRQLATGRTRGPVFWDPRTNIEVDACVSSCSAEKQNQEDRHVCVCWEGGDVFMLVYGIARLAQPISLGQGGGLESKPDKSWFCGLESNIARKGQGWRCGQALMLQSAARIPSPPGNLTQALLLRP